MIKFKFDIMEALKSAGYSSYRIRQDKLLPQATITAIRSGNAMSMNMSTLDKLCTLLQLQPCDIVEHHNS